MKATLDLSVVVLISKGMWLVGCPHPPTSTLRVYVESLMGFSHVWGPDDPGNTYCLKVSSLKAPSTRRRGGGEGVGPPVSPSGPRVNGQSGPLDDHLQQWNSFLCS